MHCYGDEDVRMNYRVLDSLDFSPYIQNGRHSLSEVMSRIEEDYDYSDILPETMNGNIFNYLTRQEVAEYLCNRYDLTYLEVIEYDYYKHEEGE